MHKAAHAYLQTQVTTTGQGDVVVLLYDGAVKFLNQAKESLAANDMAKKGINISKALDVIAELDGSLNVEKGGDLARNLHGLYSFCQNHLVKANINKSAQMIDDVIKVLLGLRSAYAEILSMPEAQAAAREAAANLGAQAITVAKSKPGFSAPTGPDPMPGAGARMRASYGKASGAFAQQGNEQRAEPEAAPRLEPGAESGLLQAHAESKESDRERAAAAAAPQSARSMPAVEGFGLKMGGGDMFKKYAAMGAK